jgi:DNA relaxase NicK
MAIVDDKLFKKNSMSYLRVMWLLKQLDFDISHYQKEVKRIMGRMNAHLAQRGAWQKEVFKEYYKDFGYQLPPVLKTNLIDNGVIKKQLAFNKYKKNDAYSFTHFVFAGFE